MDNPEIRSNSLASPSISLLAEERQQNLISPEEDNSANKTINPSESHSYLSSLEKVNEINQTCKNNTLCHAVSLL